MNKKPFVTWAVITTAVSLLLLSGCGNDSTTTAPATKLQIKAIGLPLNPSDKAQDFFIGKNSIYVTQNNFRNGSYSYLKNSRTGNAFSPYVTQELLVPRDQLYQIVGDLVFDPATDQPYMPVAIRSGGFYDYGWLQYPIDSKTPNNALQGSYRANALFAVSPAIFSDGKIYENYAGTLVAISQATGQEVIKKEGLLNPYQSRFIVQGKNLITLNNELNGLDQINLDTGVKKPVGSKWNRLLDMGNRLFPGFAINENTIYLLGITENYYLTLCSMNLSLSDQQWRCSNSENELPAGSQSIINFRFNPQTASIFYLMKNANGSSQLYEAVF